MERIYLKQIIFSLPAPKLCQSKKRRISDKPPIDVNRIGIFVYICIYHQSVLHAIGIFVHKSSMPWKEMEQIYFKQIIFSLPAPKGCQREKRRISDKPAINVHCDWDICTKIKHALERNGADLF